MPRATIKQRGMTLVETMIASAILGSVMVAVGGVVAVAVTQSKNQGSTMSQATALAAQKVDQLMTMYWTPTITPLTAGGSIAADTPNYVEYLNPTGNLVPGATASTDVGVFFTRRWKVTDSTATTKLIEVLVTGTGIAGKAPPAANMACIKARQ